MFRKTSSTPARTTGTQRSAVVRLGSAPAATVSAGQTLTARQLPTSVDILVVFDTTGSMSDKIGSLITCTTALAEGLETANLDWALTAIPFGDLTIPGDTIVADLPWTNDLVAAHSMLSSMPQNSGGSNFGESSYEAVRIALNKKGRPNALRVLLLITDDAPLTHSISASIIQQEVKHADVLCHVISPNLSEFQALAQVTGGLWLEISTHVDISRLRDAWMQMGEDIAGRAVRVKELGGSPQQALALEAGKR